LRTDSYLENTIKKNQTNWINFRKKKYVEREFVKKKTNTHQNRCQKNGFLKMKLPVAFNSQFFASDGGGGSSFSHLGSRTLRKKEDV
jgi:hypothetical protein